MLISESDSSHKSYTTLLKNAGSETSWDFPVAGVFLFCLH